MKKDPTKRKCLECGGEFFAKRNDAKLCSPKCRQKFSRSQEYKNDKEVSVDKEIGEILNDINAIEPPGTAKPKKYDYSKMPKKLTFFEQLAWKEKARKEQDLKHK